LPFETSAFNYLFYGRFTLDRVISFLLNFPAGEPRLQNSQVAALPAAFLWPPLGRLCRFWSAMMETITIEINDDGSVRVTEDAGDQTTEPMTQEFDSVGQAAQALMEMLQPSEEQNEAAPDQEASPERMWDEEANLRSKEQKTYA